MIVDRKSHMLASISLTGTAGLGLQHEWKDGMFSKPWQPVVTSGEMKCSAEAGENNWAKISEAQKTQR